MNTKDLVAKAKHLKAFIPELFEDSNRALHSVSPQTPTKEFDRTMAYVLDAQERDHKACKDYRATLVSALVGLAADAGLNEQDVLSLLRKGLARLEAEDAESESHRQKIRSSRLPEKS